MSCILFFVSDDDNDDDDDGDINDDSHRKFLQSSSNKSFYLIRIWYSDCKRARVQHYSQYRCLCDWRYKICGTEVHRL